MTAKSMHPASHHGNFRSVHLLHAVSVKHLIGFGANLLFGVCLFVLFCFVFPYLLLVLRVFIQNRAGRIYYHRIQVRHVTTKKQCDENNQKHRS